MGWLNDYTLLLRGNSANNPNTGGYIQTLLPTLGILPSLVSFGDAEKDGNNVLINRVDQYIEFYVVPRPATTQANVDSELPGYGYFWNAQKVLGQFYCWIIAAYKDGSDPGAGMIPRGRSNIITGEEDDLFWTTEVTFPIPVVLIGDLRPTPKFEQGIVDMEFRLMKTTPET